MNIIFTLKRVHLKAHAKFWIRFRHTEMIKNTHRE